MPLDTTQPGIADAVNGGIAQADQQTEVSEVEKQDLKRIRDEYNGAREFDKEMRKQYAKDRRYAGGLSDPSWASDANLIGAFIDILVSFLYARDPDVSVRAAPRAGGSPDKNSVDFAETMQIVVSRLWHDARLKRKMRQMVRSVLSVGVGWIKALVYSQTKRNPQIEKQIHDAQDNLEQIQAIKKMLGEGVDSTEQDRLEAQLTDLITGLQARVEVMVKQGMTVDFCRAEDIQVSLDIASTEEYEDADWISHDIFIRKDLLVSRFPRLTPEDCKSASVYYQRLTGQVGDKSQPASALDQEQAQFTREAVGQTGSAMGGDKPVEFCKVVEFWDHRDNTIKTFVDGVQRWAVEPYAPPQASSRFYAFFRLAFYETDGSRHPQSLSFRLRKLQDEYAAARSGGRLTRERSIPGTVFNRGQLSEEDATKIQNSTHMEMVGINPTTPDLPLDKVITAKPVPRVDPALYDTSPIHRDMMIVSGVQEAQQQAVSTPKTATEAQIQQSGFASRTSTDRDTEEMVLGELAKYTAEIAIQSLELPMVQKIAGPLAFWPVGMAVDDIVAMCDVDIRAGTTGKPQANADKETWATLLPLLQQMMEKIQVLQTANPPLATGYRNLLRETLKRLDDRLDIDDVLPQGDMPPPPPTPPQVKVSLTGQLPPQDAQILAGLTPTPDAAAAVAGGGAGGDAGGPPVGNGAVNNPGAQAPPVS
jgi:hypothetical protein